MRNSLFGRLIIALYLEIGLIQIVKRKMRKVETDKAMETGRAAKPHRR
jgi:hypothetical protein